MVASDNPVGKPGPNRDGGTVRIPGFAVGPVGARGSGPTTATARVPEPAASDVAALTGIAGPAWESGVKAPNRPVSRGRPGARSPWTGHRLDAADGSPLNAVDLPRTEGDNSPPSATPRPPPTPSPDYGGLDVAARAAAQSQAAKPVVPAYAQPTQLTLDLGDTPRLEKGTGLPEMTGPERVRAELDILGLDASAHIVDFYGPMLDALGVIRSTEILGTRSRSEVLIAGVKVATQTPPIRSGRRVVFLTLDDATGPIDATFFEDAQGPYATTVFHSWMLLVRGITRRTGPRGISVRATGAWELSGLWDAWTRGGLEAVLAALEVEDREMVARNDAALAAAVEADGRDLPVAARVGTSGGGRERGGDAADLWAHSEAGTSTPDYPGVTGTTPTTPPGSNGRPRWLRSPPGSGPTAKLGSPATRREPGGWAAAARCPRVGARRRAPDGSSSTRPASSSRPTPTSSRPARTAAAPGPSRRRRPCPTRSPAAFPAPTPVPTGPGPRRVPGPAARRRTTGMT